MIDINVAIEKLKLIALNVNSYGSTIEYIKTQIEVEKKTKKLDFDMRVIQLEQAM